MKRLLLSLFALCFLSTASIAQPDNNDPVTLDLMPVPTHIQLNQGKFRLTNDFKVAVFGNPNDRIYGAATRMLRKLSGHTGLFVPQDYITKESKDSDAQLIIRAQHPGKVQLHEDESYELTITPNKVSLTAPNDLGALHGMQTILQLINSDQDGYYLPALEIKDSPRFAWRGLLMDVGRHFMPMDVVKRNIDGLAAVKMNVLHWHLSEDQGFRVESKVFPKLQEMGSDGKYYTQEQIKEIIKYANDRGIRVVPEFDIPGHATSWLVGYPELASKRDTTYGIQRKFGIFKPTMDPTREETYQFLDKFIGEMAKLFPDPYFHIGGDEVEGSQWKNSEHIQQFMEKHGLDSNEELHTYFNKRLLKILNKYNKKMVGWDEILQPDLPKDAVVQSWRGKESLFQAAREGYQTILSNGYYIDLMRPASHHYLNDPLPDSADLTAKQKKNILGGEATMWAELVTPETVDSRIWPRTAAIAERLWSPSYINNVDDMYRRLNIISMELEDYGLTHIKNRSMMMRRLTHSRDNTALWNFVNVIEPVKGYQRNRGGELYTSYSPYTRIADIATADAPDARKFRNLVDDYVSNPTDSTEHQIRYWLNLWKNNHAGMMQTIQKAPALDEIKSLSADLYQISTIGLTAMDYYTEDQLPSPDWVDYCTKALKEAKEPRGKTELMVVSAIQKLVDLANNNRL